LASWNLSENVAPVASAGGGGVIETTTRFAPCLADATPDEAAIDKPTVSATPKDATARTSTAMLEFEIIFSADPEAMLSPRLP
jgi:hypothetical protein